MRVVYLHGFASSPASSKAQYFKRRFAEQGVACDILRLDGGDFRSLTITGQLQVISQAVRGEAVTLVGSSLGGYLAALYAARHKNVERMVLWRRRFSSPRAGGTAFPPPNSTSGGEPARACSTTTAKKPTGR